MASGVMAASAVVSVIYRDWWSLLWFLVAGAVTVGTGRLLVRRMPSGVDLRERDALAVAGGAWFVVALFGAVPFLLSAHLTPAEAVASYVPTAADYSSSLLAFRNPLHALFESMSAWTTTGLTMAVHEPSLPESFLFYRSLMQWTGGAGIIVLALTLIQQHGGISGVHLYQAEGRQRGLRPSIAETARRVWRTYLVITAGLAVYLFVATVVALPDYPWSAALFDAVNHAMAGQSTGGFSTLDDSIAGYGSFAVELIHIVPMLTGAIALPVHYIAIRQRQPSIYVRDVQNRTLFGLLLVGTPLLVWALAAMPAVTGASRAGIFQFVSAMSTTGWQTADISVWGSTAVLIMVVAMVVGGSAGATVGGIKLLRVIQMARGMWWQITQFLHPRSAVHYFEMGDRSLSQAELESDSGQAALFTVMWIVGLFISVLIMTATVAPEFTLSDIIFESASAQGTIGLSAGITGPTMPWPVEAVFVVQMWLGRLEIIPVLVFLRTLVLPRG